MAYDRELRLRVSKYTEEGHTLVQAAAVFKVNIGTLIGWRKCARATKDVKMKIAVRLTRKLFLKNTTCSTTLNRSTSSKSHK